MTGAELVQKGVIYTSKPDVRLPKKLLDFFPEWKCLRWRESKRKLTKH